MLTLLSLLALSPGLTGCTGASDAPPAPAPAAAPLPDKVLIIIDTLRADAMHYAGNPLETTPNLDALAADAAWFSRAYSAGTWTLPGTASIFTGMLPSKHRVVHDADDRDLFGQLSDDIPTVASALKTKGYRTAAFINNAFMAPAFGLNQGFDTYDYEGAGLQDHRTAQQTVDAALAWLSQSDAPSFLVVHVMEPHADYQIAAPFAGRFTADLPHTPELTLPLGGDLVDQMIQRRHIPGDDDKAWIHAAYHEEVLATDAAIGALLDGLQGRPGWAASTVVVTSDHGEEFWEHGAYEHGHSCNSVVTGVPLIVKAPGVKPHRNDSVVSLVELYPLLTAEAGDVHRLATAGVTERGRFAVSEDTLYSDPQASAVTDDLRLITDLTSDQFWFHTLDADGVESATPSQDVGLVPSAKRLRRLLCEARGDLTPTRALDSIAVPNPDVFQALIDLGYVDAPDVDAPDDPPEPDAPPPRDEARDEAPATPTGDPCAAY